MSTLPRTITAALVASLTACTPDTVPPGSVCIDNQAWIRQPDSDVATHVYTNWGAPVACRPVPKP